MIQYKLGCNFTQELLDGVIQLNDKYRDAGSCISELYGSDKNMAFLTARPDFRLPDISKSEFEQFVGKCTDAGIGFNYTMNSIYPGSKVELQNRKQEIIDFVQYLENLGVSRVTIANPILMEFVREASSTIKIELSTIAHLDTVTQIKYYKEKYNVDKICGNLLKNRNVTFLKNAAEYCNNNDVVYEVMVNEFCGVGGKDYTTHCTFRDSCYMCHASNKTKEDALSLNNYPMEYCIFARKNDISSWMKLRWVRPEDIKRYSDIGIDHFKITGRTGGTEYLLQIAEAYLQQSWDGNLLSLWKPLETIYSHENELDFKQNVYIPNKSLTKFLNKWFTDDGFRCEEEVCGETCTYCHDFFDLKI